MNRIIIFLFPLLISCKEPDVFVADFESHDIQLTIKASDHSAELSDQGIVNVNAGWNLFSLNGTVHVHSFEIDGKSADFQLFQSGDVANIPAHFRDILPPDEHQGGVQIIAFKSGVQRSVLYSISYSGKFYEAVEDIHFSNENVGREVAATISERGAYFSPLATYYPTGNETMTSFKLTANIPETWESISDGNRLSNEIKNGRKIQSWNNPYKNDGNMFMAAPFVTKSTWVDDIEVACYFFEADTGLFDQYLPATAGYIRQYSELIGPYPYERFTVVENFFPTGYGMPAWTLLGQQVIRLPFIVYTSLGHEVLHNWWGNSVYVDYDRGNWCESATVYGADYRYKLQQSPEAAKTYRKDILKQYANYVTKENDFPIREFKSRTSKETRTIGYNKAMMVFHMIEEEIGKEPFFEAWKQINSNYREQKISWEEWISMFEQTSGKDLGTIIPQWIDQDGAPILGLKIDSVDENLIHFTIEENSDKNYTLSVPVRYDTGIDTTVVLNSPSSSFSMNIPAGISTISIDPDFHLFRRLYPEEIEPIISATLGNKNKHFYGDADQNLFKQFADNISDGDITIESLNAFKDAGRSSLPVVLNPTDVPSYISSRISIGQSHITINVNTFPLIGHTFIFTGKDWNGIKNYMVILSHDYQSLPRIGQLVPHYGKYSFLVFEGSKNVGKGQWDVTESPLKKKFR